MDFVTADLHIGHKDILKFDNSPRKGQYTNVEQMDDGIIAIWTLGANDS